MNIIQKLKNKFIFSKSEQTLYEYFFSKKIHNQAEDIILVQGIEDHSYLALFGAVVQELKQQQSFKVHYYLSRSLYSASFSHLRGFILSIVADNALTDKKWVKLYKSYCDAEAFKFEGSTTFITDIKLFMQARDIFFKIKTKKDLLDLKIDNVLIGDLVYDSYIRFKPANTVNIKDIYLCIVIWQTLRNIFLVNKYFLKINPKILINTYATYIQHGIITRFALKYNIKVVTFGNNNSIGKTLSTSDWFHHKDHRLYKDYFKLLDDKNAKLEKARFFLEKRFSGHIDDATSYMKSSSYEITTNNIPDVKDKVVIFLHYFQDSPHGYNLIFDDFLDWVDSTINILEKYDIKYCIKPHPNKKIENQASIEYLKTRYNAMIISEDITNKQLRDAGIVLGVSVRGTVAHELIYQGVPVLLCGDNPHNSYNFCYEAKNLQEYEELLKNHKDLKVNSKAKLEIESFYYMHNLNFSDDELQAVNMVNTLKRESIESNDFINILDSLSTNSSFKLFVHALVEKGKDK